MPPCCSLSAYFIRSSKSLICVVMFRPLMKPLWFSCTIFLITSQQLCEYFIVHTGQSDGSPIVNILPRSVFSFVYL